MTAPPEYVIASARDAALKSPCAKSKRGVVAMIVRQRGEYGDEPIAPVIASRGWNGQPDGFACSGSTACRESCAKLCMHAEQRAILNTLRSWSGHERYVELVHVKVVDGAVVPGGGPSCWQCSRLVVEVGLRGVWLFEAPFVTVTDMSNEWHPVASNEQDGGAAWRFYTAEDFHRTTQRACGIVP